MYKWTTLLILQKNNQYNQYRHFNLIYILFAFVWTKLCWVGRKSSLFIFSFPCDKHPIAATYPVGLLDARPISRFLLQSVYLSANELNENRSHFDMISRVAEAGVFNGKFSAYPAAVSLTTQAVFIIRGGHR